MRLLRLLRLLFALVPAGPVGLLAADPIADWGRFEKQVRDQEIPKDSLERAFPAVWAALRGPDGPGKSPLPPRKDPAPAAPAGTADADLQRDPPWVFPVSGYSPASVGKGGYRPDIRYGGSSVAGYDFFDGNRHGGHPAYDIFIRDRNRDSRDDRTGKPVAVVAPVDLVVLSTEPAWEPGSALRGGRYLWAKDRRSDRLFYFSHLDSVAARPGEAVAAGGFLGTVGRTGKNAHARRSPTHVHFMALRVAGGKPVPFDPYPFLAGTTARAAGERPAQKERVSPPMGRNPQPDSK